MVSETGVVKSAVGHQEFVEAIKGILALPLSDAEKAAVVRQLLDGN